MTFIVVLCKHTFECCSGFFCFLFLWVLWESLLKLGPGFHDAAKTVFKQVVKDYPDSARAKEATEQLERISKG